MNATDYTAVLTDRDLARLSLRNIARQAAVRAELGERALLAVPVPRMPRDAALRLHSALRDVLGAVSLGEYNRALDSATRLLRAFEGAGR
jgi:hypothetical protein